MSLGLRPVGEWVKAHVSVCLGECLCEWMCAHPCVGVSEPPIPLSDGHQLEAILLAALGQQNDHEPSGSAVLPHSHCLGSGLLPGKGDQGSLFHWGLEERQGEGGPEGGSGLAAQWGYLPSAPPAPLPTPLPSSSPLRLRVHRAGDPWELEANFPRSLVMERPQVLPLIKVKRGAEEKCCMQASSSHLQKPYANN